MEGKEEGGSSNNLEGKRKGIKRKIPMDLIKNEDARQVCFSKRRTGLFKKALELNVLCGAQVRVLVFSPAGNPYSFISPSSGSSTLDQFFPSSQQPDNALHHNSLSDLSRQASELQARMEVLKSNKAGLEARLTGMKGSALTANLEMADLAQLEAIKKNLEQFFVRV